MSARKLDDCPIAARDELRMGKGVRVRKKGREAYQEDKDAGTASRKLYVGVVE